MAKLTKVTKEQVEQISQLARIELTKEEKKLYSDQLSEILKFVEKLEQVNTDGVTETSQVTGLKNIYREDVASERTQVDKDKLKNREKLLANAPAEKGGYVKTRAVLE